MLEYSAEVKARAKVILAEAKLSPAPDALGYAYRKCEELGVPKASLPALSAVVSREIRTTMAARWAGEAGLDPSSDAFAPLKTPALRGSLSPADKAEIREVLLQALFEPIDGKSRKEHLAETKRGLVEDFSLQKTPRVIDALQAWLLISAQREIERFVPAAKFRARGAEEVAGVIKDTLECLFEHVVRGRELQSRVLGNKLEALDQRLKVQDGVSENIVDVLSKSFNAN